MLNPNGLPQNNKMATTHKSPSSPFIAQGGKTVTKGETKYPLSFNGDICLDLREGEIDGP